MNSIDVVSDRDNNNNCYYYYSDDYYYYDDHAANPKTAAAAAAANNSTPRATKLHSTNTLTVNLALKVGSLNIKRVLLALQRLLHLLGARIQVGPMCIVSGLFCFGDLCRFCCLLRVQLCL